MEFERGDFMRRREMNDNDHYVQEVQCRRRASKSSSKVLDREEIILLKDTTMDTAAMSVKGRREAFVFILQYVVAGQSKRPSHSRMSLLGLWA